MKKTPRDIIILHMCTINNNHIMYGSWDMKCDGYRFLSCSAIFCSFALLTTQKIQSLKKGKKPWEYYHFTHVYNKWQSNDLSFLRYGVQRTMFFVILHPFCTFTPTVTTWKMKLLKKMEKTPGDIIILHMCTINANHMMYGSWDIERDGHNVLSFWTIFRPFTTPTTQKIKILKKGKKNPGFAIILQICTINDRIFCHFGPFLHICPLNILKNQNFEKMKKPEKLPFHTCVIHVTIIWCMVPKIWSAIDRIALLPH